MANSYKRTVPLAEIVPGDNPRDDFGDIGALAATLEVTGGQPLTPIIVVADGNRYRIVDGERRYRALKKLHDANYMVDVLVYTDFAAAQEAVAMLATDDKMQLTDAERAKGFQQMMVLGVESRTIAKALHRKTSDIAKARTVAKSAPPQATIDQLIAAADFEDEKDRRAVLEAKPGEWRSKASLLERKARDERQYKELCHCAVDLGFDIEEKAPEGYESIMWASTAEELRRMTEAHDEEELAVWPAEFNKRYLVLGHKTERREVNSELSEEIILRDRRDAAYNSLRLNLLNEVATCDVFPELQEIAGNLRRRWSLNKLDDSYLGTTLERAKVDKEIIDSHHDGPASMWETLHAINNRYNNVDWAEWVVTWLPPILADEGTYYPSDEDLWLLELARDELSERDYDEC